MNQEVYNLVSILVLIGGFTIGIGTLLLIWRQILQAIRTREVEVCLQLASMSSTSPIREAIESIWSLDTNTLINSEHQNSADIVCVFFELVGSVCARQYMSTDLIESYYGSLVTGMFERLEGLIKQKRKLSYHKYYAQNFERLAITIKQKPGVSPQTTADVKANSKPLA